MTWFIVAVMVVLQGAMVVHLPFLKFQPEILLILCVYIGATLDWQKGFWWGIVCGMMTSVFSMVDVRICIIIFALSGMLAGSFRGSLFVDNMATKIILLFFISMFEVFLFAFFSKGISLSLFQGAFLQKDIFKIAFINSLFAIPLYYLLGRFYKRTSYT